MSQCQSGTVTRSTLFGERQGILKRKIARSVLDFAGYEISYLHAGSVEDRRIIYINGTPGPATDWKLLLLSPIEGAESIAIDRPGYGRSLPKRAIPSLGRQAEIVAAFLEKRQGRWPILVGHSYGSAIAARVAAEYPDRIDGLLVASGTLDPGMKRLRIYSCLAGNRIVGSLVPPWLRSSYREIMHLRAELEELQPMLGLISCPVVIVHDAYDPLVPFGNVDYLRRSLKPGLIRDVMVLKWRGHYIMKNSEAELRKAIELLL